MPPRKPKIDTKPPPPAAPPNSDDEPEDIPLPDRAPPKTKAEANNELHAFLRDGNGYDGTVPDNTKIPGLRPTVVLKPHQIQGWLWMRGREDSAHTKFGGILADDMGVGKTLQTIACIVARPCTQEERQQGWSKATLIVVPPAVLDHWEAELEKTTKSGFYVIKYHESARKKVVDALPTSDVVLTTYGVVRSEHTSGNPTLYNIKWLRIVLDEAHTIKNRATKAAAACFELQARFRWCLTGTPMPNTVADFFSYFKFLHIKPVNEWAAFNSRIVAPIDKGKGDPGLAMKQLQVVLKVVLLRRTKEQLDCLKLPSRFVKLVSCKFDSDEQTFYSALKAHSQTIIRRLQKNTSMSGDQKYMNILVLLLRLRQACNHPALALSEYKEALHELEQEETAEGGVSAVPKVFLDRDSDSDDPASRNVKKCAGCAVRLSRKNVSGKDFPDLCLNCATLQIQGENLAQRQRASAKIKQILTLVGMAQSFGEKTVVFSQWTSFLTVLEHFLMARDVKYTRYDGSMTLSERAEALKTISEDPRVSVILVSLKAGGQGLNLTSCSRVILADMWWSPAIEEQAFDRAHRVGQTRNVHIYKLRIEDTVEDRILELQERKRELAKMALSGTHVPNSKLGMEELLGLFR